MSGRPWLIAVTVDGVNLPRFLRRAGEMGLLLTGVRIRGKHLSAFAREDDVMTLRMMAENGGWRFSVGNRQGTGRLMTWIRHRLALLSALMLGIGALIGASQVMWRVEIENAGIYAADLPEYLQALGITPPMRKSDVHPGQLRDLLEWRYPETARRRARRLFSPATWCARGKSSSAARNARAAACGRYQRAGW